MFDRILNTPFTSKQIFTCLKSIIEKLEKGLKYVPMKTMKTQEPEQHQYVILMFLLLL